MHVNDDDELQWFLYVDIYCLEHDGNLMDACTLALVSALQNTALPEVVVSEDGSEVRLKAASSLEKQGGKQEESRSLVLGSLPVSLTMSLMEEGPTVRVKKKKGIKSVVEQSRVKESQGE